MQGRKALGFAVALAIGAIGGATVSTLAAHALRLRSAHADGTMSLMQHHVARLRQAVRRGRCDATDAEHHVERLRAIAPEIEYAFADRYRRDADFAARYRKLVEALARAPTDAASGCTALERRLAPVQAACEACHRDYR